MCVLLFIYNYVEHIYLYTERLATVLVLGIQIKFRLTRYGIVYFTLVCKEKARDFINDKSLSLCWD